MYQDYAQFKQADRKLRAAMGLQSDEYLSHVKEGMTLFHGEGNHNVQIVNDLLDTASAGRLQRNRIIQWLEPITGHEVVKLTGGKFGFGKKIDDVEYDEIVEAAPEHFMTYPDWYAFKPEQVPEDFDPKALVQKLIKRALKDAKALSEHDYTSVAAEISAFAERVEVLPLEAANAPESDTETEQAA